MKFSQAIDKFFKKSEFEEMLSQKNLQLVDILNFDEIEQSVAQDNGKLFKFLKKNKQMLYDMVDLIIKVDPNTNDQIGQPKSTEDKQKKLQNSYKFPFIVSEIFSNELPGMNDYLFGYQTSTEDQEDEDDDDDPQNQDLVNIADDLGQIITLPNQQEKSPRSKKNNSDQMEIDHQPAKISGLGLINDESDKNYLDEEEDEDYQQRIHKRLRNQHDFSQNDESSKDSSPKNKQPNSNFTQKVLNPELRKQGLQLLNYLLNFLNTQQELDPTLCGYFAKSMGVIIQQKNQGRFFQFISDDPSGKTFLSNLYYHSYNNSLAQILSRLLFQEGLLENHDFQYHDHFPTQRLEIIDRIIRIVAGVEKPLLPDAREDYIDNFSSIFFELRKNFNLNLLDHYETVFLQALSPANLQLLFAHYKSVRPGTQYYLTQFFENILECLLQLLENRQKEVPDYFDARIKLPVLSITEFTCSQLQLLHLEKPTQSPLGLNFISLLDLLRKIIAFRSREIDRLISEPQNINQLFLILMNYPSNSSAHNTIGKIINQLIQGRQNGIFEALLLNPHPFQYVLEIYKQSVENTSSHLERLSTQDDPLQKQNFLNSQFQQSGILIHIGNHLEIASQYSECCTNLMAKNPHWQEFSIEFLKKSQPIHKIDLGYYLDDEITQTIDFKFKIPPETPVSTKRIMENGSIYEGPLKNGELEGQGVLIFQDGRKYSGGFLDGKFSGQGVFQWTKDKFFEGTYEAGKRVRGKFQLAENLYYSGEFDQHGQLDGKVIQFKNNEEKELIFSHGEVQTQNDTEIQQEDYIFKQLFCHEMSWEEQQGLKIQQIDR